MQQKIKWQHVILLTCFVFPFAVNAQKKIPAEATVKKEQAFVPLDKEAIKGNFKLVDFVMEPGELDQAVEFSDPAGEQTVVFNLVQGGAIVSFVYKGIEHTWRYNGGGLLQMAFHNSRDDGPWAGDYNPTQAGDGTSMSPVTGIGGNGKDSLVLITMMLDFNHNNGFYPHPLLAVWGGKVDENIPASYFSPYVLETFAHWVKNPGGEPKYYLRLDERITHLTEEVMGPFAYDFADYQNWEFNVKAISPENCPCDASKVSYMAGGLYTDNTRKVGLAIAMPSSNFPNSKVGAGFNSDYMWRNNSFHLSSVENLDGIASKKFVWYVMAGSWEKALQFSKTIGISGGVK